MPEGLEKSTITERDVDLKVIDCVANEVLETMFFTEAIASQCDHSWFDTAVTARISFDGSHVGEFLLGISREAARSIAASFLGLAEEETTEKDCGQVILELANILCGAVLSNRWPESRLSLATPELGGCGCATVGALHRCFMLPEGALALTICAADAVISKG